MENPIALPAPPVGCARIGWSGFALALPEEWNLSLHGPARQQKRGGLLVFSDLRGPAFEIRWKVPRHLRVLAASPQKTLLRTVGRLKKGETAEDLGDAFFLRRRGLVLAAGGRWLYEMHCPRQPELAGPIARDFLKTLKLLADGPWLWAIYGIQAWLPKEASLRDVSLRPGDCRMSFRIPASETGGPGRLSVGVFSLAHQLMRGRSLAAWGAQEFPAIREGPKGTWEEKAGEGRADWRANTRRLGRTLAHEVHLRHDPALNRLHWTHQIKSGK